MKLLMISGDRAILQGKKGAFWYTLEEFRKHWERIDVMCPKVGAAQGNEAGAATVVPFDNVHFHPSPWSLWHQPRWIDTKGAELIREFHHDVMTVHDYPPFYNGRGARRLARATGVPAIQEIHHLVGYPTPASIQERIGRWMTRLFLPGLARSFAAVRVVNDRVHDQLVSWGVDAARIGVVPSFYLDRADVLAARNAASREPSYDLAFCARLDPNKGLLPLIELIAAMPDITLVVVGDGVQRGDAETLARRLGCAERVTFRGWLPEKRDALSAIRSAKVFVMNSLSEGGPRIALEAMACGMPVIATKVGVMPDVIADGVNGLLVDGSSRHLAHAIRALLPDEELRHRMGAEATQILDHFDRTTLIRSYADFLKGAATSRVPSSRT